MLKHLSLLLVVGCLVAAASVADAQNTGGQTVPPRPVEQMTLYIGTYTREPQQGICIARFNPETGAITTPQIAASTPNPSFLVSSADGRFLYAANEWGPVAGEDKGGLSAFRIAPETEQLAPINSVAQAGNVCHLAMDATGKWLVTAAYGTGTVSTWRILPDGSIGTPVGSNQHTGSGPNQNRQREPHAHHVVLSPDNRRVFSVDLGIDKVVVDDLNPATGELVPAAAPFVAVAPGAGPRHAALSSSGQFLYVVSELNNTITAFKDALGLPQQFQVISTLPADFTGKSATAEIAIHPNGRFLYVSNRGHNSIACYAIKDDGQLELVGFSATGRNPRHFTFDPSGKWLLAANQSDRSIGVFKVNLGTGSLAPTQLLENVPGDPVCLLFVPSQAKK